MELSWLKILEILGLFFGATYVIGAILEKRWCWYAGIIATILYAISVYFFKLYGEFILQFFYLGVSIYGLSLWKKSSTEKDILDLDETPILKVNTSSYSFLLKISLFGILLSAGFYFVLIYFGSSYPFWDAVTSGFGITTTYMTAKKKIENWIFWIIIDIILTVILYLKGMPFYSILYIIYTLFAILGFYQWSKEYKSTNKKIPS